MPDPVGLLGDRLDEVRVGMAKCVDRHPGGEIEITLAARRYEPRALAALEGKIDARVGRQQMRGLGVTHRGTDNPWKRNVPPLRAAL